MKVKLVIFCALFISPINLVIAENNFDPCKAKNGGALAESMCMEKDLKSTDIELNKTYQAAIKRIKEEEQYMGRDLENKFRKSQRAWLKFRNSYCEFEGDSTGAAGGWAGIHIERCRLDMSLKRIEYFKSVFWG